MDAAKAERRVVKISAAVKEYPGIGETTIRHWVRERVIWSTRVGGTRFIDADEIGRLIEENAQPARATA